MKGMSLQDRLNEYWTVRAPSYDADQLRSDRREADRAVWSTVFGEALPAPPADVLDLGTGSGYVAWLLHDLGYRVSGVDAAPGMLDVARGHSRPDGTAPRFFSGDAQAPHLPAGSFDAVTARYVLWTMRDPAAALTAWRRLLRSGGVLVIVDGLWFPHGLPDPTGSGQRKATEPAPTGGPAASLSDLFAHAYAERASEDLPLATSESIEESVAAVRAAGFADVELTPLRALHELDTRYGAAPGHQVTWQYRIRASAP